MGQIYEFHFQEGFTGEIVTLAINGEIRVQFAARTRLQTGLAHIEQLKLELGELVSISVPDLAISSEYRVVEGDYCWVTINLIGKQLDVQRANRCPGYV